MNESVSLFLVLFVTAFYLYVFKFMNLIISRFGLQSLNGEDKYHGHLDFVSMQCEANLQKAVIVFFLLFLTA